MAAMPELQRQTVVTIAPRPGASISKCDPLAAADAANR
jgi:hypothetical protein